MGPKKRKRSRGTVAGEAEAVPVRASVPEAEAEAVPVRASAHVGGGGPSPRGHQRVGGGGPTLSGVGGGVPPRRRCRWDLSFPFHWRAAAARMDPEVATELVRKGAMLLFLDVPQRTLFGIDTQMFSVGPKFKGFKMVPLGPHFIYYCFSSW